MKEKIHYYTVKISYSVRTKPQALELKTAMDSVYRQLVEVWSGGLKLPKDFGKVIVDGKKVKF